MGSATTNRVARVVVGGIVSIVLFGVLMITISFYDENCWEGSLASDATPGVVEEGFLCSLLGETTITETSEGRGASRSSNRATSTAITVGVFIVSLGAGYGVSRLASRN